MLALLLDRETTYREISKELGKGISSISDEINNNGGRYAYDPYNAEERARALRIRSHGSKIDTVPGLKAKIIADLRKKYSPEQIAETLRKEAQGRCVVSYETIYTYIYSDEGRKEKLWLHLRHKKSPKRISRGTRKHRSPIPNRVSIHDRPPDIEKREIFGHWEADLMIFSSTRKVLAVFVERMTRTVVAFVNNNKSADAMKRAMQKFISTIGIENIASMTFDNGTENVLHEQVRQEYHCSFQTYFCDPYASWQKGTVENTNKLIRQYLPRTIEETMFTQKYVDAVMTQLNHRPRKTLNFETPHDRFTFCSF
jgi:IS30 family transposase